MERDSTESPTKDRATGEPGGGFFPPSSPRPFHAQDLFIPAAVCLIFLRFAWISMQYPYYFAWDMDLVAAQDCLAIHSGLLPDHIAHPGFGMYLLLFATQKAAHAFGFLSAISLSDLSGSLNPLAGMAELTGFIRGHAPFLALGCVLMLWGALVLTFRPPPLWRLFLLLALGTQESLLFHAAVVRTDLFSLFYWSAALFLALLGLGTRNRWGQLALILAAGIALGLCFLTKMQALFYIVALPLYCGFALALPPLRDRAPNTLLRTRWGPVIVTGFSLLLTLVFTALLMAALRTPIPEGVTRWNREFGLTPMAVGFLSGLTLLFAGQCLLLRRGRAATPLFAATAFLTVIATGFLSAFRLHFALYRSPGQSLTYLLHDFKIAFTLQQLNPIEISRPAYTAILKDTITYAPILFAVHFLALALVLALTLRAKTGGDRRALLPLLGLTALAMLSVVPGSRGMLRDFIWVETLTGFLTLSYLLRAATHEGLAPLFRRALPAALLALVIAVNLAHNARMPARIDANHNNYGWQDDPWLTNVFGNSHLHYRDLMDTRYAQGRDAAKRQAMRYREIRRTVHYVVKNQRVTHRNIGVLAEDFPVWTSDMDWTVARFPEELREAILVDTHSLETRPHYRFNLGKVQGTSEDLDKFGAPAPGDAIPLALLARPDLRVLLFVDAKDVEGLESKHLTRTGHRIALARGPDTRTLEALEVWSYAEIPLDRLTGPHLTVIQARDPKLYFPYDLDSVP